MNKDREKPRKKKFLGQHFLRKQSVVDNMIDRVTIDSTTSIMEIGCGDGFLTRSILTQSPCKQLRCYEIDPSWADYVRANVRDERLTIKLANILDIDWNELAASAPWVLLANLPYQITFPILFLLQKNKQFFSEGVVMVQEEVAQKLIACGGRGYTATILFLQYHLTFELMEKIEPGAFSPPPKIHSRLVYFKPKMVLEPIEREEEYWKFLKCCFKSPRRTLRNNLQSFHYSLPTLGDALLSKRAQELSFADFLVVWKKLLAITPIP